MTELSELNHLFAKQLHLRCTYNESGFGLFSKFAEESTCINFEFVLTITSFPEDPGHSSKKQAEKLSISFKFCSKKLILPIVLERWKDDASMLRESFHCLCSIDTNACFAWKGVVNRVL